MKLLIIGGGGYVGSVVSKYLSQFNELEITIIDKFLYVDQDKKIFNNSKKVKIINIHFEDFDFDSYHYDIVIFFAGLVGDPITKKYPELSILINENSILNFISKISNFKFDKFIFISTCSNYGLMADSIIADEESTLNPLSLYAKSKVKIEKKIIDNDFKNFSSVILRFSTAFGLSDRMRFDLTVNQFTYEALYKKKLIIYDPDTWRPYCHVSDFARAIKKVIESPRKLINNQIFNVGLDENNSTKRMLVEKIKANQVKFLSTFNEKGNDPRNYRVSFKKINQLLNFYPKINIDFGIKEILDWLKLEEKNNLDLKGNFEIEENFINYYF